MHRTLTIIAFLVAASARAWLHFTTPLVQGMNGGYYLVQARSLIEKLSLAIPDLPLTFTLHALLAKTIHLLTTLSLNESVMLAVKLADSILPALLVIPVMLLGKAWSREGSKIDLIVSALAAVLIAAGGPALLMLGDFEKNSLGLALLCTLVWALHRWVAEPTSRRMMLAVAVLGLIGLTHIGVFGTTLIFASATLGAVTLAHGREGFVKVGRILVFAAPVVIVAASIVFWKFDPARVQKLLHAFSEPGDYLSGAGGPPGMKSAGAPMMMPGMNGSGWMQWVPTIVFFAASLSALGIVWWQRRRIGLQNLAVVTGLAITVIVITGPWVHGDKVMRFQLNAVPLAVLCLLFALLRIPRTWWRGVPAVLLLGLGLVPTVEKLASGPRPIITEQAARELQQLSASVEDPARTLIVAHHGLEWWTAWTLHTHIAQAQALKPEDWTKYKYVWFIEDKRGMRMPFGGGGGPSLFGKLLGNAGPPNGPGGRMERGRSERGMMPPMTGAAGPDQRGGNGGPPGVGGMGGGPMAGPSIPTDADVLHEGEYFKLAWVKSPPTYLTQRTQNTHPLDPFGGLPF